MKILWITNIEIPLVSKKLGNPINVYGGWLDYLSTYIVKEYDVCFVCPSKLTQEFEFNNFSYFSFTKTNMSTRFDKILKIFNPDIIHLFGTELDHVSYVVDAVKENNMLNRMVISIQGLVSMCAYHYLNGLPHYVCRRYGIFEVFTKSNLYKKQRLFEKRGKAEIKAIEAVKYIEGRTKWDYISTGVINLNRKYFICNEALRSPFYDNSWNIEKIERHSIFISQCSYPLKGFHKVLDALKYIIKFYPDVHIYTTGRDLTSSNMKDILKLSSYQRYLRKKIKNNHFEKNISFLGYLSAEKMCDRLLKSNLFVSPSSIENSSNSIAEAMIVGCPVVSSSVGGIQSLLENGKEGLLYQADAPYLLAWNIMKIFKNDQLALSLSDNAKKRAQITHNRLSILEKQLKIYDTIYKDNLK